MSSPSRTVESSSRGRNTPSFDPFIRRAAAVIGLAAIVVVVLLFLWTVAQVLLLLFAGLLLGIFLHGLAKRLKEHSPLSYGWSLSVVALALIAGLSLIVWLIAPQVASQLDQLRQILPESVNHLEAQVRQYGWGEYLIERTPSPRELLGGGEGFWSRITGVMSTALGILANVIVIVVIGIYVAVNPGLYKRGIVQLVPHQKHERARDVLGAVGHALWKWLMGQLISMTIVGVLVWIGLMLLGMPVALGLGFIAGLSEFVPLIGPWAGAIPGLLVSLMQGQVLYVGLMYLAVQQLESNVITPIVMKEAVSLAPALTISSTIIGGALFGIPGILLATPLTVAIMVLVQEIYVKDVLGNAAESSEG